MPIDKDGTILALPETAKTRDGRELSLRREPWSFVSLAGRHTFDFSVFGHFSKDVLYRLKFGILWYIQNKAASSASLYYNEFKVFYLSIIKQKNIMVDIICISDLQEYRNSLGQRSEWRLAAVRTFLLNIDDLGFGITSQDALGYLEDVRLRGMVKGASIRVRDRNNGAFTSTELLTIQTALNDAHAGGQIDLTQFAVTWLLLGYGIRPIQIAALKESDLVIARGEAGKFYALRIPRAKQRGQAIRTSFKTRYCSKQIGHLLEEVIRENRKIRSALRLSGDSWPMFMKRVDRCGVGFEYHFDARQMSIMVSSVVSRLAGFAANPRRFRITLAQRAVDDGKDKFTVADLLDHSDLQNVGVYYEASPSMVLRLDRHMAMTMAPLAQAFAGVIVRNQGDALRGADATRQIFDRSLINHSEPLGICGQMSFCGLTIPYACCTCRHFRPWVDGPHEEFLTALIDDRNRMESEGYSSKIYSIRDRTILAVAEVVQLSAA